jgi:hypothetical protein
MALGFQQCQCPSERSFTSIAGMVQWNPLVHYAKKIVANAT